MDKDCIFQKNLDVLRVECTGVLATKGSYNATTNLAVSVRPRVAF
jgi:hypothetical protein